MTRYRSRKCESCERIFDFKVTTATARDLWKCPECRVTPPKDDGRVRRMDWARAELVTPNQLPRLLGGGKGRG